MSTFDDLYNKLNKEQKIAVDLIEGPVMVIAGPGTGKTQVLTLRIANILQKTDTNPDSILALTFTESGVRAMRERLFLSLGISAYYVNIHTFHSFASEVIQANPDEFIISTKVESLSDLERTHIFKEIFDEENLHAIKPFNSPYYYLSTAISKIQDLKREGIDTNEYLKYIEKSSSKMDPKDIEKNNDLLKVYKSYQNKLLKYGRYDFEDMINFVTAKFKSSPSLLLKYQERFQYFLVDEFQDTNSAQAELLYQLSSYWDPNPNLFVVGDDDQSIYRFQGASIENIVNFNAKYPNAVKVALTNNYRSNQKIIDSAQNVISNNSYRISTKLNITKDQKSQSESNINNENVIFHGEFSSSHTENHFIATKIKELLDNKTPPNEIAVIYRNNSDSTDIADMLSRLDIEYSLVGGENVLESGIIIRLLHLLRVIHKVRSVEEDLDMFTLLNYEFLEIDPLDVLKLSRYASFHKQNFFEVLQHDPLLIPDLKNSQALKDFFNKLVFWNEISSNTTFVDFLQQVIEESNFLNWVLKQPDSFELLNKLNSFMSEVKRLNYSNKSLTLAQLLSYIDLMTENNIRISESTLEIDSKSVKLTTAHKSKGLEFKYVFVPKFVDKKWGNTVNRDLLKLPSEILETVNMDELSNRKKHEEEDERRLFYVVLTRAKEQIYITSSKNYQTESYQKITVPSMFIHEISEKMVSNIQISDYEKSVSEILKKLIVHVKRNNLSSDEKDFLSNSLKNFKLSASSLNSYLDCAYKFKLEYLFKTPEQRSRSLIMGTAVHKALEFAYTEVKEQRSIDIEPILNSYTKCLQSEILNQKEFDEVEKEGYSVLKIYYQKYFDEFNKPNESNILFLEKFFGWGFSKPLLDGNIHLQGKIDKIELLNAKSREIQIVDYKTGRPKSRNEILGNTKYADMNQFRQLMFYKLMIDLDKSFNFTVSQVALDYTGHRNSKPKREVFEITKEDIENLSKTIREVTQNIKDLKFERTDNYSICNNCKFRFHCWPDKIPVSNNMQLGL